MQSINSSGQKTASIPVKDSPSALSYSSSEAKIAVGFENGEVVFYSRELKEVGKFQTAGNVSTLAYSPDGKLLVSVRAG